jgi:hypothetical protein
MGTPVCLGNIRTKTTTPHQILHCRDWPASTIPVSADRHFRAREQPLLPHMQCRLSVHMGILRVPAQEPRVITTLLRRPRVKLRGALRHLAIAR